MSTSYIRYPSTAAPTAEIAIGQAVTDGDPSSVLFIDATGELAQDVDFLFDAANLDLTIGEFSIRGSAISGGQFGYGGTSYFSGGGTSGMYMTAPIIAYPSAVSMGSIGTTHAPFKNSSHQQIHIGYAQDETLTPVAVGTIDAKSALTIIAPSGVQMPSLTTTQKNAISSPTAGRMVYDSTLNKLCVYTGSAWETITSI